MNAQNPFFLCVFFFFFSFLCVHGGFLKVFSLCCTKPFQQALVLQLERLVQGRAQGRPAHPIIGTFCLPRDPGCYSLTALELSTKLLMTVGAEHRAFSGTFL